jgi:hypothetical protein
MRKEVVEKEAKIEPIPLEEDKVVPPSMVQAA